jgi:Tol biopolymer transport system component
MQGSLVGRITLALTCFILLTGAQPSSCQPRYKIVFVSARDGNSEIYTVNTDATQLVRLTEDASVDEHPAWSPDGTRIAFVSDRSGSFEVYVMNADGTNVVRRTFSGSDSGYPTWSADGSMIAYSTMSNGSVNIWTVSPDTGSPSLLFEAPGWDAQPDWSPDGAQIALSSDWHAFDFVRDIFVVNSDGSGFTALTENIFDHFDYAMPAWSPDGAKLSLAIVQTVGIDQYVTKLGVMNADGSNLRPLISTDTETRTSWSPNGQRIAFTSGSGESRSVSWVNADGTASGVIVTDGWNADYRP